MLLMGVLSQNQSINKRDGCKERRNGGGEMMERKKGGRKGGKKDSLDAFVENKQHAKHLQFTQPLLGDVNENS